MAMPVRPHCQKLKQRLITMIVEILHAARRLDGALGRKLGAPYHAVLGIGLVLEIGRNLDELGHQASAVSVRPILAVALFGLLLLHQMAELAEHIDERRKRQ
jgi:hypothetical protein